MFCCVVAVWQIFHSQLLQKPIWHLLHICVRKNHKHGGYTFYLFCGICKCHQRWKKGIEKYEILFMFSVTINWCEAIWYLFWYTGMDANLRYCRPVDCMLLAHCCVRQPCWGTFDGKCKGRLRQRTKHGGNHS